MLREMPMAMSGNPDEAALVALVDVTRRRLAALDEERDPSVWDRFGRSLIECVYAVILGVTIGSWTVLGFVVWVPLLVRNTMLLAGTVLYVSLYRDQAKLSYAQGQVQFAARFYARGFEHFLSFYRQRGEPYPPVGLFEPLTTVTRGDLLVDGLWVITVWGAVWRLATVI